MNSTFNTRSTLRSIICGLMLCTLVGATPVHALSREGIRTWVKNHRLLCLASIALPIFGMYARKTITKLIPHRKPEEIADEKKHDYFESFAEAFNKTVALAGKMFKVIRAVTSADENWLNDYSSLS